MEPLLNGYGIDTEWIRSRYSCTKWIRNEYRNRSGTERNVFRSTFPVKLIPSETVFVIMIFTEGGCPVFLEYYGFFPGSTQSEINIL